MNHQHLESSFRRYEKLIEYALGFYPDIYVVDKQQLKDFGLPLSLLTCCARCRDAIASLIVNKWKTNIDTQRLKTIRRDFIISIRNEELWFGSRDTIKTKSLEKKAEPLPKSTSTPTPTIQDLTPYREAYMLGFVTLASKGLLKHPIRVHIKDQEQVDEYEKRLGIAFIKDEQGWVLLP